MIESFVRNLLAPLYRLIGYSVPIFILIVIGIILFFLIGNIKMHVKRKGDSQKNCCFVPYMEEGEIEYVITGKKNI